MGGTAGADGTAGDVVAGAPGGSPAAGSRSCKVASFETARSDGGACGSGRVMADILSGRKPEIDISGLTVERYGWPWG